MFKRSVASALALAVVGAGLSSARGEILDGVQPGALDQPQINMIVYLNNSNTPQIGVTQDPLGGLGDILGGLGGTGGDVPFFNVQAYLDTGASSILVSNPTAGLLNIGTISAPGGLPVIYADVGVAGRDNYNVSVPVQLRLAPYVPGTNMDNFLDVNNTQPDVSPYTVQVQNGSPIRVQIGPYVPPVDTGNVTDPIDQLIEELAGEQSALDVVGMPAMKGKVMVVDPTGVKNLGLLFSVLGSVLSGGDITDLTDADLTAINSAGIKTYLYDRATAPAFDPNRTNNPGIPTAQRHVALTYASFDRFTAVSAGPGGAPNPSLPGPTLEHNPFIGKDPVAILEGRDPGNAPGITITRAVSSSTLSSTGNWLLDTGAAASIISENQALALHVQYDRAHGNGPGAPGTTDPLDPLGGSSGGATPLLVDTITGATVPNQFTLVIGGVGGQEVLAGFWLDTLKLPTKEGTQYNRDDLNITYTHVPVLVGDITVADPLDPTKTLTLDGVFGMNMLVESIQFATDDTGNITDLGDPSPSFYQWFTFDEPNAELGLVFDPETVPNVNTVPEPASLGVLAVGALAMLPRRRRTRPVR